MTYYASIDTARSFLREHVLETFKDETRPERWGKPDESTATGHFSLLLLCFAHLYALAGLHKGTKDTKPKHVIEFVEKYLPTYAKISSFLIDIYRHGVVHQRQPKSIEVDGLIVSWLIDRGKSREKHLALVRKSWLTGQPTNEKTILVSVQLDILYHDIVCAGKAFADDTDEDDNLAETVRQGIEQSQTPQKSHNYVDCRVPWLKIQVDQLPKECPDIWSENADAT